MVEYTILFNRKAEKEELKFDGQSYIGELVFLEVEPSGKILRKIVI